MTATKEIKAKGAASRFGRHIDQKFNLSVTAAFKCLEGAMTAWRDDSAVGPYSRGCLAPEPEPTRIDCDFVQETTRTNGDDVQSPTP